jgi:tape measure domain-containing protein
VAIDARAATRGAAEADKAFKKVSTGAGRVDGSAKGVQKSFADVQAAAFRMGRVLGPLAAVISGALVVDQINQYQQLSNKLRLTTNSSEELIAVQTELFNLAQQNRASLPATVDLYSRLARSSEELGLSQREVIKTTDLIGKAIAVSGTGAQEASAAIFQLGQGLASGTLRGDELRSVLEQTPRLARAIADGLGVNIGKLRELGQEGKLTAEQVINAINSQSKVLEEEFGKTLPTLSQNFEVLKNSALQFVGQLDEATGFSAALGGALQGLSRFLDENRDSFAEAGFEAAQFLRTVAGVAKLRLFDNRNSDLIDNKIVGTIATIFGDEDVIEAASQERLRLEAELDGEYNALLDSLDKNRAAFEQRKRDREAAAKVDLTAKPEVKPRASGPDEETLKRLKAEQKELEDFARSVAESIQTPLQVYEAQIGQLDKVLAKGLLTQDQYALAVMQAVEAFQEADPVMKAHVAEMEEVEDLVTRLRTPYEVLTAEIEKYRSLLDRGLISEETWARAVMESTENYKAAVEERAASNNFLEEISKQAARNIQDAFANFLFNPLEEGFDGLLSSFVQTLQRMAAEALSAELFKILAEKFTSLGASGGGGFLSTILGGLGAAFGGARADGGPVQPGKQYLVGEEGPEMVSFDRAGSVTPAAQTAAAMTPAAPQVNVPVQVVNVQDPNEIPAAMQGTAGQQAILNVLTRNKSAIRQIMNGA